MKDEAIGERTKKAFDFYADATKQLITLSTGMIALMIAFAKDVLQVPHGLAKLPLTASLVLYLFSIWFGLETLLNLTGMLQPYSVSKPQNDKPSIYDPKVLKASKKQVSLFIVATGLVVLTFMISTIYSLR
jgi:hypothetical protein